MFGDNSYESPREHGPADADSVARALSLRMTPEQAGSLVAPEATSITTVLHPRPERYNAATPTNGDEHDDGLVATTQGQVTTPVGVIGEGYVGPRAPTPVDRARLSPGVQVPEKKTGRPEVTVYIVDRSDLETAVQSMSVNVGRTAEYQPMCLTRPSERQYTDWILKWVKDIHSVDELGQEYIDAIRRHCPHLYQEAMRHGIAWLEYLATATPDPARLQPGDLGHLGRIHAATNRLNDAIFRVPAPVSQSYLQPAFDQPTYGVEEVSESATVLQSQLQSSATSLPTPGQGAQRPSQIFQDGDFCECNFVSLGLKDPSADSGYQAAEHAANTTSRGRLASSASSE